ncbi:MAG TPA: hypothetical protein VED37_10605 [Ktedonobacteraceae bacterium]|nr:hypothetical protein [Ktedonobacteraceae bacterium]
MMTLESSAEGGFRAVPESISYLTRAHALLTKPTAGERHAPAGYVLHQPIGRIAQQRPIATGGPPSREKPRSRGPQHGDESRRARSQCQDHSAPRASQIAGPHRTLTKL